MQRLRHDDAARHPVIEQVHSISISDPLVAGSSFAYATRSL